MIMLISFDAVRKRKERSRQRIKNASYVVQKAILLLLSPSSLFWQELIMRKDNLKEEKRNKHKKLTICF